ncbi:MAG TPA: transporter substrate-binding domain-containing protein [Candidatus Omnitrophota bacterium]|nr:transporter substrate-binding domain-containing protein [Candidatus Omnitrophota bacterium]HQO58740.1 transporter substrate-binding domain-containing protein [Candidatus Omnitrophota bacterium]
MKFKKNISIFVPAIARFLIPPVCIFIILGGFCWQPLFLPDAMAQRDSPDSGELPAGGLNGRKVRVGLYENKPKIFTNEAGVASGIFPTILHEIGRKEKWQLIYIPCQWNECLESLENGRIDLMPDVAFSAERDERLDFHSEVVVNRWSVVYAKKSKRMTTISDLNGQRIAVLKGSIQYGLLQQMVQGFGLKVSFLERPSFEEAFGATARGDADAVVANQFLGDYFYRQYGLEKTPVIFNPVSLYFATAAGSNTDLLKAIDKNLLVMKSQPGSTYYKALQAWVKEPPGTVMPPYFIWLLGSVSGILFLAVVFIWLLRRQVRVVTRNLIDANERLSESEKKFRDIFQKHTAVKLIIDLKNGNIIEANEAAEKFYGWSRAELLRMRMQDINMLAPEQVAAELEQARREGWSYYESRYRLANGSARDVEVFSSVLDIKGETFLHSIIHDITEKRKLEQQYRQAQKMESVGRLAGGVAHDYNNMLSLILGYTELALAKTDPADPIYANLTEVLNAARRSVDITRQLLAFARRQPMEPKILDLNQSMMAMLKMLQRLIGEDIELIWRPGAEVWPVYIDPTQLDQILANLCTNARDAIAGVGKLIIETGTVTFDEDYCVGHEGFIPGDFTMLAVSDDGCGMDRETLNNIFEPFFTTKGEGKGTGLGLATVYGIVKQNNGFINVYSEPGRGTTFRIYLPRREGAVVEISSMREEDLPRGHGERVLLVEDDKAILALGSKILEELGYHVLSAKTPTEAQRLAGAHAGKIDLLITDVIMPEMNGRELSDRLRALYPGMKILFMSGYTADVILPRGVLEEGVIFMQKPFTVKDVSVKVNQALGKGRETV